MPERPSLSADLSEQEFRRWYWMKAELVVFARSLGVSTSGSKPDLAERVAASLAGRAPLPTAARRSVATRLVEPLTLDTKVPPRHAASQQIRGFLSSEIGPSFYCDIHMRTYLLSEEPKTLRDVTAHWYATRKAEKPETLPQLELVRFMKRWHVAHPDGTAAECRSAWRRYRSLPVDERTEE